MSQRKYFRFTPTNVLSSDKLRSIVEVELENVDEEHLALLDSCKYSSDEEEKEDIKCRVHSSNVLRTDATYSFDNQELEINISSDKLWRTVSFFVRYDFSDQIEGIENIPVVSSNRELLFKIDLQEFDRHCLEGDFTFEIDFIYDEDEDSTKVRTEQYKVKIPYFRTRTNMEFGRLGQYFISETMANLFNSRFGLDSLTSQRDRDLVAEIDLSLKNQSLEGTTVSPADAIALIRYALSIEDLASQDQQEEYDLRNVKIGVERSRNRKFSICTFPVPFNDLPPNCMQETSLCIVPMSCYEENKVFAGNEAVFASIDSYSYGAMHFRCRSNNDEFIDHNDEGILTKVFSKAEQVISEDVYYLVRFIPKRISYRAGYQALKTLERNSLQRYFIEFEHTQVTIPIPVIEHFEWFNEQIAANEEQKLAIKNIVNCTAFPFPYVVFGPPGTGKSSLIVEAIAQILILKPDSRILVTAQSNSACDEIGVRLLRFISPSKMYRYYSTSLAKTSEQMRCISNLRGNQSDDPTLEEYEHFNVVIATLMGCSRLIQIKDVEKRFNYIFIDECAAATMPEALIPIVELGTTKNAITSNIVVLGDHNQLGPVINSRIASQLGLGLSLMERIMKTPRYSLDPITKTYDNNYVIQLLENFRSHPAILQFSNVMFYNSCLRAKLQEPERSFGTSWEYLPNKKLPMLFDCVKTPSQKDVDDTSSFNEGEIERVRFYIDLLLRHGVNGIKVQQTDIGIVSPYKAQLNKLTDEFEVEKDIEIGTSEYYQGREKKIIIISTVKSFEGVGFLKNERRLNVCITRAKSLLILVGNGDTLQQSPLWNSLLHFLKANNACCGEPFGLVTMTEQERMLQEKLNAILIDPEAFEKSAEDEKAEHEKAVNAMRDRLAKLEELMREL